MRSGSTWLILGVALIVVGITLAWSLFGASPERRSSETPPIPTRSTSPASTSHSSTSTQLTGHDDSQMSISTGPDDLLLTDIAGRRTGRDPVTHEELEEIPNSAYLVDALNNDMTGQVATTKSHLADFSLLAPGRYTLTLTGLHDGPYDLTIVVFSRDGLPQRSLDATGNITVGQVIKFVLELSPMPGQNSTLTMRPN